MLLIDQNLPLKLKDILAPFFPGTVHVKELHMERSTDTDLWRYAVEKELVIITKDSDFYDRLTLKGHPPKLIWVRTGNASTLFLVELFRSNISTIQTFVKNPDL